MIAKSKESNETKAYLINKFTRIKTFSEDDPAEAEDASLNKVRFIRNLKYCDLFARNEDELVEWMNHLSRLMIRTDFHERYKINKMIGEGSFAKVGLNLQIRSTLANKNKINNFTR